MALEATRELLLKLVVQGSPEAKAALAEVEAAAQQVGAVEEKVATSTEAATAATRAQTEAATGVTAALEGEAAAAVQVETILETKARLAQQLANQELKAEGEVAEARIAATLAMNELGVATVTGGKAMTAALLEARNAVAQLEVAIVAARATGAPIGPQATAELDAYNLRLQALSAETAKAASRTAGLGAEASIATGSIHGFARGATELGGEFSRLGIGLIAALAALDVLPQILDKVDSKTKELAASVADTVNGLHDEDLALKKSGESQEAYEARVQKIRDLVEEETRARVLMGAGLIQEVGDRQKAIESYEAYAFSQRGIIQQFPELQKAAEKMGISFKATHEEMAHETEIFFNVYLGQLRVSQGNANAWAEANKAVLDKIVSYYQRAGEGVPPQLIKIAESIGLVTAAEKEAAKDDKLKKHLDDESIAYANLSAAIADGVTKLGSMATAAAAQHAEIDKQIEQLEKQQRSEKGLTDTQRDRLNALIVLHAEVSALTPEQEKLNKANDDAQKAIIALGQEERKLKGAYEETLAAIREHAAAQIAASDAELRKIQTNADAEIAAISNKYRQGKLGEEEFHRRISELQNLEVAAKRATQDKEDLINREKIQGEKDATDKFVEGTAKVKASLEERNSDLAKAEEAVNFFNLSNKAATQSIADQAAKISEGVTTRKGYETQIKDIATAIGGADKALVALVTKHDAHTGNLRGKAIPAVGDFGGKLEGVASSSIPKLESALDGMINKLEAVRKKLGEVDSAASSAFSMGGGGAGATGPEPSAAGGTGNEGLS